MKSKTLELFYQNKNQGKKSIAVLLDPDKLNAELLAERIYAINKHKIDFVLVGGSLIASDNFKFVLSELKDKTFVPIIIFPGDGLHVHSEADGILLLSLISGRNADFLIGQHMVAAPLLKRSGLDILPTGYMLVDGGAPTTVSYISNTFPLPHDKPDLAACTAMAGEMLGLQLMYLDAGSGAKKEVSSKMIQAVKAAVGCPLIVGGGINTFEKAKLALEAGADVIVIGNAIEQDASFIEELAALTHQTLV
jgi:geranylgeranylglyceryl phosphate synthase family protein